MVSDLQTKSIYEETES